MSNSNESSLTQLPENQPPDSDNSGHQVAQSPSETTADTGKEGGIQISNEEFNNAVFNNAPEGASAAVCSKPGDPQEGGWKARPVSQVIRSLSPDQNNYINCSSFYESEDGLFSVKKENFAVCHFLLLDDLDENILSKLSAEFTLSWVIETSPGNCQAGIILKKPITDAAEAKKIHDAIIKAGFCDPGASGPASRWARLPVGINGKPKYRDVSGKPFRCKLIQWNPEKRYAVQEIIEGLKLNIADEPAPETKSIVVEIDTNANPPIKETHSAQLSESDSEKLDKLKKLLEHIDPDIGYQEWLNVLIAIFNETDGSDEGLELADDWSSKGEKYKGSVEIRSKWESFDLNRESRVTIATLYKIVRDNDRDLKVNPETDDSFRKCNDHENIQTPEPMKGSDILAEHDVAPQNVLDSAQRLDPLSYPDKPRNENGRVPATIPNVKHLLNSYGITVRYNTIRKKLMITIPGLFWDAGQCR